MPNKPKLGDDDKRLEQDELRAMLDYFAKHSAAEKARKAPTFARRRDYVLVQLLALTGLRASEAAALKLGDVRFGKTPYVRVRGGKCRGRRDVDTVPMPWVLADPLHGWCKHRRKQGAGDRSPVFTAARSGRAMTRKEVWVIVKRSVHCCRLRPEINVHSLRHYYVTSVARQSKNFLTVAKMGRLRSPHLVREYIHQALGEQAEVARSLKLPGRRPSRNPAARSQVEQP